MEKTEMIGLKKRSRSNGEVAYYWVASSVSRDVEGYPLKTVRLTGTDDEIATKCQALTEELREWQSSRGLGAPSRYTGTLRSLIKMYRTHPSSPYFDVREVTRVNYDLSLDLLDSQCGMRRLEKVTGLDIRDWYNHLKEPPPDSASKARQREKAAQQGIVLPPNQPRARRAYQCMQLLRIVIGFGVVSGIQDCFRLKSILEEMRFHVPPARRESISFEQVKAICDIAIERGLHSIALAQALQFELTLRQSDVIGIWERCHDMRAGGIIDGNRRWRDGLLWSHLDASGILTKETSKVSGMIAVHDTMQYPFLRTMIDLVPVKERFGPMIKFESSGMPYKYRHFARLWRDIARQAGVPDSVWNRDSRAGGVTEGSDAGADIEHLRHHANHSNAATTQRYNRRTLEKTREVARLRVAKRSIGNGPGTGV